jgi:hypothetical protein
MYRYFYIILFSLGLGLLFSCSGENKDETEAAQCASDFSHLFFNFRYTDALRYVTPESERVLQFCASNMSRSAVDSLKNITDTPSISVQDVVLLNVNEGECTVNVDNVIINDTIGGFPVPSNKSERYRFKLVRHEGAWKVKMEDLPRNEK